MKSGVVRWWSLLPALGLLTAARILGQVESPSPPENGAPPTRVPPSAPTIKPVAPEIPPPVTLPRPHVLETAPGQFQIVAMEAGAAHDVLVTAEAVWATLAAPLDLPERFPGPVTVQVVAADRWAGPVLFRSFMERDGAVSVQVRWSPEMSRTGQLRRALVQALLFGRAVAWDGPGPKLRVPLWLEQGCAAWSLTRERPAMLDEWQQLSAREAPPPLTSLLGAGGSGTEDPARQRAVLWLVMHLQAESGSPSRWLSLVHGVLGGEDSLAALQRCYGALFKDAAAREMWWDVGWYYQRQFNVQPMQTAPEARRWLGERARWLAWRGGAEVVLTPLEIIQNRHVPWVEKELAARLSQITTRMQTMHPYYLNALISLGRADEEAAKNGNTRVYNQYLADFKRDMADGLELEQATDKALDAVEVVPANGAAAPAAMP